MSTPAGRSSRMSESTVFGVGSMMSMSRLCVRISKCSRLSLYLCGDLMTQKTFFSVGSGTGPAILAPVRVTVSTILRAELSMTSWSYAFSRMRIFCPAIVLLSSFEPCGRVSGPPGFSDPRGRVCRVPRPHGSLGFVFRSGCRRARPRGSGTDLSLSLRFGRTRIVMTTGHATATCQRQPGKYARQPLTQTNRGGRLCRGPTPVRVALLDDLGDPAGADGAAAFANRELEAFLHRDGLDQLDPHLGVVARHHHLGAFGQVHNTGHVRRTEVELGAVVVEERLVPSALFLRQDVDLRLELGVRRVRARLDTDHAAIDVL